MITDVVDSVRREGFAIWPDFLDTGKLRPLQQRCRELATGPDALAFPKSTRVWDLFRHGRHLLDVLTEPGLTQLMAELLGEHFLLSDYSLNVVQPDQPIDDWHVDYPFNEMPFPVTGSILGTQCILLLDDFTAANGGTHIAPGTHSTPRRPAGTPTQHQVVEASAGSLVVMAAAAWHRSGYNASRAPRAAILLSFVERWVRPMSGPPEPGPWSATPQLRLLLGQERPPETINGVPITG